MKAYDLSTVFYGSKHTNKSMPDVEFDDVCLQQFFLSEGSQMCVSLVSLFLSKYLRFKTSVKSLSKNVTFMGKDNFDQITCVCHWKIVLGITLPLINCVYTSLQLGPNPVSEKV